MNFRRWLFVLLSVVTIGANSESVLRLVQNAIFKVSSSKFDFCSTGGSVDDARHMAAMAYSSCVRVAYCICACRRMWRMACPVGPMCSDGGAVCVYVDKGEIFRDVVLVGRHFSKSAHDATSVTILS